MDEYYWKKAYANTWGISSERERWLAAYLERETGRKVFLTGFGAGSTAFIPGNAEKNGYQKGDADLYVDGTNIYIEVTGPLVKNVKAADPLWFRPDKLKNAAGNAGHDVFLAHHCMSEDLWRIIHIDNELKEKFAKGQFPVVTPFRQGRRERYVEIAVYDKCIKDLSYLVSYIKADSHVL